MKKILLVLIVIFVAIQFVRPNRTPVESPDSIDLIAKYTPPPEVRSILSNACYDCHSNKTRYPWYSQVQPMAWFLANHINEGRKRLNFSEFGQLQPLRAVQKLDDCVDEITERRMPLASYRLAHADARLTQAQINTFVAWLDQTAAVLREASKKDR
jgi:hypothetical protein